MRYLTFGEMMLRLRAPRFERLFQSPELEATFAGSEANAAVSLANYGQEVYFISVFPENNVVARAAKSALQSFGIDTGRIVYGKGRFGVYYIEQGSNLLPNKTYYDREWSSMALAEPGDIDWDSALDGIDWLHISGITSAVSESAAELNLEAAKAAKARGIPVSCDLNYRGSLWKYGKKAAEVMPELVRNIDVSIATESEIRSCLGIEADWSGETPEGVTFSPEKYRYLSSRILETYPNLKYVALTLQKNLSADGNILCASIYDGSRFVMSKEMASMDIVDRVGAGDAVSAGLLYGLNRYDDLQKAVDFAAAAGTLKGSIPGDFNRVSVEDVESALSGTMEQKR
jgi:2-dehydro-3-deoxygluconokinase